MGEPPSKRSVDLDQKFADLRASYRRALPEHLERLAAAVETARAAPSPTALEGAFHAAHRLKGTSGSFGFVALATELETIEEILDRVRRARAPLTEEEAARISAALARARALRV